MSKGRLEGKVAVISGSGRGIGRSIALMMAKEGASIVVNDPGVSVEGQGYDEAPADEVVATIQAQGGKAIANYENVKTPEAGEAVIKAAVDAFGRVDILVNNAGILRERMIFNMSEEEWDDVVNTHLHGQFNLIRPASAVMRQQRYGRIINFTSMVGLQGSSGQANYGSSKTAVAGLTRAVARELGSSGVTCNAVAAGAATRMTDRHRAPASGAEIERRNAGSPQDGPPPEIAPGAGGPDDVAPLVCYLASDDAWNINGQSFRAIAGTVAILNNPEKFRGIHKQGVLTLEELDELIPKHLLNNIANPSPPPPELPIPGRPSQPSEESK